MKIILLLLMPIICLSQVATVGNLPARHLHLYWDDPNAAGVVKYFVVFEWSGRDTLNSVSYDTFSVVKATGKQEYILEILANTDWIRYGIRAYGDSGASDMAETEFTSYQSFVYDKGMTTVGADSKYGMMPKGRGIIR